MSKERIQTKSFEIKTPHDVAQFFMWLAFDCHLNFHPDDNIIECLDESDEPVFTDKQCDMYNDIMDQCFEVCEKFDRNIYTIASSIMGLYSYCDCNDEMAKFCWGGD